MSDFTIGGPTNDLVLTNGDLTLVTGSAAIAQNVLQQLQFFLGEWFLDNTQGVGWFQDILVKTPNLDVVNATIQNTILAVPGIIQLLAFTLQYTNSTRQLAIAFQAQCTNGETISITTAVGI